LVRYLLRLGFSGSNEGQDCSHGRTNLAMVDYGAGVAALVSALSGSDGSRCSCSPWLTPVGFFLVFAAGAEALMVWVSFHHRTSPRDF
jgi:hypothetical protein